MRLGPAMSFPLLFDSSVIILSFHKLCVQDGHASNVMPEWIFFVSNEGHFPMLMRYVLDGVTASEYIPSVRRKDLEEETQ